MLLQIRNTLSQRTITKGYSLPELLVVVAIIGILVVGGINVGMNLLNRAKKRNAQKMLQTIKMGIDAYHEDMNVYPERLEDLIKQPTDEKLSARYDGPYLSSKKVPLDPWGNKYNYQVTPDNADHPYDLFTYSEGKRGGSKKGKKLSVWDEN